MRDWLDWHGAYDDAESPLRRRLEVVRRRIGDHLDDAPPGAVRAISMCAGQGRDLLDVLAAHPRGSDVAARLVELDARNVAVARHFITAAGLTGIDVLQGDAGTTSAYQGAVPADLVIVAGVFGNITDDDVARTVRALPEICAPGATVVWTRHRRPPDLTDEVRRWFASAGFEEVAFDAPLDDLYAVGTHRLVGDPRPFRPSERLFTFT